MSSTNPDSFSIDSLGAYSQPTNGNVASSAAPAEVPGNRIRVPRRLNDQVQFSRECRPVAGEEEAVGSLCSNFMAAWG